MNTIKCQYTGIEFEAESKRSKNHPLVSAWLNEVAKDSVKVGAYAKAKELLAQANGQFESINECMTAVKAAYKEWYSGAKSVTVLSWKQRVAIGKRDEAARRNSEYYNRYEEMTDGNGWSGR